MPEGLTDTDLTPASLIPHPVQTTTDQEMDPRLLPFGEPGIMLRGQEANLAADTVLDYLRVAGSAIRRATGGRNLVDWDNPTTGWDQVVGWLDARKPHIRKATYRHCKAALLFVMAGHPEAAGAAAVLETMAQTGCGTAPRKNQAAVKRKDMPPDHLKMIMDWLSSGTQSEYRGMLGAWLKAGYYTGVRPNEWAGARIEQHNPAAAAEDPPGPYLVIRNAKATHERGLGRERWLSLHDMSEESVRIIQRFLGVYQTSLANGTLRRDYSNCAQLLRRANLVLWPWRKSHYTLYSARHAFSSNAKGTNSRAGTAALMGHKTDLTAARHYGKRKNARTVDHEGNPIVLPQAMQSAIDQVGLVSERRRTANQHAGNDMAATESHDTGATAGTDTGPDTTTIAAAVDNDQRTMER